MWVFRYLMNPRINSDRPRLWVVFLLNDERNPTACFVRELNNVMPRLLFLFSKGVITAFKKAINKSNTS